MTFHLVDGHGVNFRKAVRKGSADIANTLLTHIAAFLRFTQRIN